MASVTAIPAQYAKFITALAGVAIGYLTAYGTTWNLQGALVAIGAALAVFGVPNTPAPVVPGMTVDITSTDPAQVGQQVAAAIRRSAATAPIAGIRPPDAPSGNVSVTPPPPASIV